MWSWIKSQFCSHLWDVRATVVGSPQPIVKVKLIDDCTLKQLLQGVTSILLTCAKCGSVRSSTYYGQP